MTSRSARRSRVGDGGQLDDLIGMFVNTLVFRTQVDGGGSFGDSAARSRVSGICRRSRMPTCRSNGWSRCSIRRVRPHGIRCSRSGCRSRT